MYLNRITTIGRLVADPEFKKGSAEDGSNDRVWSRIAVNRPGSDEADFIPFCCWGATARAVSDHCKKGKVLILDGQLRTRSTQREDGSWNNYFEVNCNAVYFGPDAKGTKGAPAQAATTVTGSAPPPNTDPKVLEQLVAQLAALTNAQTSEPVEAPAADPFNSRNIPL